MRRSRRRPTALLAQRLGGGKKLTDIAEQVLGKLTEPRLLTQQDIIDLAIRNEFLTNPAKTPPDTLLTQIDLEIRRDRRRGVVPRFVLVDQEGTWVVGLSRWSQGTSALKSRLEQHNRAEYGKIIAYLHEMPPERFEELIGRLLSHIGFDPL